MELRTSFICFPTAWLLPEYRPQSECPPLRACAAHSGYGARLFPALSPQFSLHHGYHHQIIFLFICCLPHKKAGTPTSATLRAHLRTVAGLRVLMKHSHDGSGSSSLRVKVEDSPGVLPSTLGITLLTTIHREISRPHGQHEVAGYMKFWEWPLKPPGLFTLCPWGNLRACAACFSAQLPSSS